MIGKITAVASKIQGAFYAAAAAYCRVTAPAWRVIRRVLRPIIPED